MIMEMRTWVTIAGLPVEDEARWEPFIAALERDHANLGPTLGWGADGLQVVLSMDTDDQAAAARTAVDATVAALRSAGLGDLYPASIEVEPVAAGELAETPA